MQARDFALDLVNFIDCSPTMYHATAEVVRRLEEANFNELKLTEEWSLKAKNGYYIVVNDSAVFAFKLGKDTIDNTGFKLIGAHTDSPALKIKPNPIIIEKDYIKLNTEVYGGAILNTWFDRPLSIAGRVMVQEDQGLTSRLLNIDRDLTIIPNLAIHMNRDINKEFAINPQQHTLPLFLNPSHESIKKEKFLTYLIADTLDVAMDNIIDMDLYLYPREKGKLIGLNDEFISVGRQDNLSMIHSSLSALINTDSQDATLGVFYTDNEEVGSRTIQGANSNLLASLLSRLSFAQHLNYEQHQIALSKSFMISADMAHAYHPNFSEVADPTNQPILNKGIVLKVAANKSYVTDGYSASVIKNLCKQENIPYQSFTNASDKKGGSTIGPITEGVINIKGVDIGNALWAMHSIRELGGVEDHLNIYKLFNNYFQ